MSMKPGQTTASPASTTSAAFSGGDGPRRGHRGDAVAGEGHVAAEPGVAAAVDDAAPPDQHVPGHQLITRYESQPS